ncbi:MAG: glutathionylspermidine synthase family protein [Candidatus Sumerlaeaceae bacterium]|nr:glutathionylspermidine synthase family protein [Candidatus Sumerlaeaceae bacterium]
MIYHSPEGQPYWDESACYRFTSAQVDELEKATYELDSMCLDAVQHVLDNKLFDRFLIPPEFADYVTQSWETDEITIYGRFDLAYDGAGPPKLLEYNADTPTALLEAAVVQWHWLQAFEGGGHDQFNSIHERLIEAWGAVKPSVGGALQFAAMGGQDEDFMTVNYLRDTAMQAGLETGYLDVEQIGWNEAQKSFVDLAEQPMWNCFKLYPWEWMITDEFGKKVLENNTRWFEPPWKMILSNKATLPLLWEMFPESPYLVRALREPLGGAYIKKPLRAREGANVSVVEYGITTESTTGPYEAEPCVYQELVKLPCFEGNYVVVGSWMVNGYACGVGLREDTRRITGNTSRFVPHFIAD